jgi:hypothetical protein
MMVALMAWASSACNSNTAGCTIQNCQAAADTCHLGLGNDSFALCLHLTDAAGGMVPPGSSGQAMSECQKACTTEGLGPVLSCVVANASQCSGGPDAQQAVATKCARKQPTIDPSCADSCFSTYQTCANACPVTSFNACLSCGDACDTTFASCEQKCPPAS